MVKILKKVNEDANVLVITDDSIPGWWDVNNLGYYATDTALTTAHPTANNWNYAIVWTTDSIWIWDWDTNSWKNSGLSWTINAVPNTRTLTINWTTYDLSANRSWTISWWGGWSLNYIDVTSNQSISPSNFYWVTCTTSDITLTLADWTSIWENLTIKKLDNTPYNITISGNIEQDWSIIIDTQFESIDLFWNWTYYLIK